MGARARARENKPSLVVASDVPAQRALDEGMRVVRETVVVTTLQDGLAKLAAASHPFVSMAVAVPLLGGAGVALLQRALRGAYPMPVLYVGCDKDPKHARDAASHGATYCAAPVTAGAAASFAREAVWSERRLYDGIMSAIELHTRPRRLTDRESRILVDAVLDGPMVDGLAAAHDIKACTVRTHLARIRDKTGAATIRQLVNRILLDASQAMLKSGGETE